MSETAAETQPLTDESPFTSEVACEECDVGSVERAKQTLYKFVAFMVVVLGVIFVSIVMETCEGAPRGFCIFVPIPGCYILFAFPIILYQTCIANPSVKDVVDDNGHLYYKKSQVKAVANSLFVIRVWGPLVGYMFLAVLFYLYLAAQYLWVVRSEASSAILATAIGSAVITGMVICAAIVIEAVIATLAPFEWSYAQGDKDVVTITPEERRLHMPRSCLVTEAITYHVVKKPWILAVMMFVITAVLFVETAFYHILFIDVTLRCTFSGAKSLDPYLCDWDTRVWDDLTPLSDGSVACLWMTALGIAIAVHMVPIAFVCDAFLLSETREDIIRRVILERVYMLANISIWTAIVFPYWWYLFVRYVIVPTAQHTMKSVAALLYFISFTGFFAFAWLQGWILISVWRECDDDFKAGMDRLRRQQEKEYETEHELQEIKV